MNRIERPNSTVILGCETVRKFFRADVMVEYEKACLLHRVAEDSGFAHPKPLEIDEHEGWIDFQRLQTGQSLRDIYLKYMQGSAAEETAPGLFFEAGRFIGQVHADLELSTKHTWSPTAAYLEDLKLGGGAASLGGLPHAFLHGDYGFSNIELLASTKVGLAVFDPSPNYFSTFHAAEYGPIYVDLGQMVAALEGMVPPRYYPMIKWSKRHRLIDAFLTGYNRSSAKPCDAELVDRFAYATARSYFARRRFPFSRRIADHILYSRLKR